MIREIEDIKKKNGNAQISQKDLLWYVIHKVDAIDGKLDTKVSLTLFKWTIGLIVGLFIAGRFV